jgi:putative acetyltransferase
VSNTTIRSEETRDLAAIRDVEYAAFENHPQHEPGALPTEHKIVDALREAGALTLSLVLEDEGQIVGHIAFSPVLVDGEDRAWYSLGPVAIVPDRQRQGLGSELVREGVRRMQEQGAAGLVLVGDPHYYTRFGFAPRPELTLEHVPPEVFLALPLAGEVPTGAATFHEAFWVQ